LAVLLRDIIGRHGNARKTPPIPLPLNAARGYRPDDIDVVCAFDIDARKVGRDVSDEEAWQKTEQFIAKNTTG
jgi:myo-inositol-1-phosphate synthase